MAVLEALFTTATTTASSFVISLDQQQCFDRATPELAIAHLLHQDFSPCELVRVPFALVNFLIEAMLDVQQLDEPNDHLQQAAIVDDREGAEGVTQSPNKAKNNTVRWDSWCERLGLMENKSKTKFVYGRLCDELQLRASGITSNALMNCVKILGIKFSNADAEVLPVEALG